MVLAAPARLADGDGPNSVERSARRLYIPETRLLQFVDLAERRWILALDSRTSNGRASETRRDATLGMSFPMQRS